MPYSRRHAIAGSIAPSEIVLLTDALSNAVEVWGLTKARAAYAGNCCLLERDNPGTGPAQQTFGFVGNEPNYTSMVNFATEFNASGNADIVELYGHINGITLAQTTPANRFRLIENGSILTFADLAFNTIPAIRIFGTQSMTSTTDHQLGDDHLSVREGAVVLDAEIRAVSEGPRVTHLANTNSVTFWIDGNQYFDWGGDSFGSYRISGAHGTLNNRTIFHSYNRPTNAADLRADNTTYATGTMSGTQSTLTITEPYVIEGFNAAARAAFRTVAFFSEGHDSSRYQEIRDALVL